MVVNTDSNVALSPLAAANASNEGPSEFSNVSIASTCPGKRQTAGENDGADHSTSLLIKDRLTSGVDRKVFGLPTSGRLFLA